MKKIVSLLIAVLLLTAFCLPTSAAEAEHSHQYYFDYIVRSEDGKSVKSFGRFCKGCNEMFQGENATLVDYSISYNGWGKDGQTTWYFIDGYVSLNDPLRISGTVNLVLLDNSLLVCNSGIRIFENSTLNIYSEHFDYSPAGEENKMGRLYSLVTDENECSAAIGGYSDMFKTHTQTATVNIYGGDISADSAGTGAAIGSGEQGNTTVNIYGGKITATSSRSGAALGTGYNYAKATVNVYGGITRAASIGNRQSASIGNGLWRCNSVVNFYGGYLYGAPQVNAGFAGMKADTVNFVDGAKRIGKSDGFYDSMGLELAKQAGWIDEGYPTASILSDGSIWIILAVAVIALGGVAALVIVKKKKKPAVADEE